MRRHSLTSPRCASSKATSNQNWGVPNSQPASWTRQDLQVVRCRFAPGSMTSHVLPSISRSVDLRGGIGQMFLGERRCLNSVVVVLCEAYRLESTDSGLSPAHDGASRRRASKGAHARTTPTPPRHLKARRAEPCRASRSSRSIASASTTADRLLPLLLLLLPLQQSPPRQTTAVESQPCLR